ncbi:MAG: hypothetical protein ACK5T6_16180, partial [Pirellula sp.]
LGLSIILSSSAERTRTSKGLLPLAPQASLPVSPRSQKLWMAPIDTFEWGSFGYSYSAIRG